MRARGAELAQLALLRAHVPQRAGDLDEELRHPMRRLIGGRDAAGLNWGGALEELQVLIDGTEVWESTHPPDDFESFSAAFTATSDTAVLKFNNNSPVRQSWLLDLSRCRSR